jgi:hypothetical protein
VSHKDAAPSLDDHRGILRDSRHVRRRVLCDERCLVEATCIETNLMFDASNLRGEGMSNKRDAGS